MLRQDLKRVLVMSPTHKLGYLWNADYFIVILWCIIFENKNRIKYLLCNVGDTLHVDSEEACTPTQVTGSFSSLQFRSLQATPAMGPRTDGGVVNLSGYFPRVGTDPPSRKRYHTAPREKHRVRTESKTTDFPSIIWMYLSNFYAFLSNNVRLHF